MSYTFDYSCTWYGMSKHLVFDKLVLLQNTAALTKKVLYQFLWTFHLRRPNFYGF